MSVWRIQSSGVAIERYAWIRAKVSGCEIDSGPLRRRERQRVLAVADSPRATGEHCSQLVIAETCDSRRAQREQERAGLLAIGVVGGVEHLLGRHEPEEVEQVERAPDGGVEEDTRTTREAVGERGEVGDAAVGDDQLRVVTVDERGQLDRDRRKAAAAVDEDRHAAVGGEPEDGREPLVVQVELLGARVEFDAARARIEAARGLADRILVQVEPHERNEPSVGARREGERAVVRGAEGRMAVGLVETEHERSGESIALLARHQLVEVADPPVDVGAEMDMRVEDLQVLRKLCADELLEALDERLRAQKHVLHDP